MSILVSSLAVLAFVVFLTEQRVLLLIVGDSHGFDVLAGGRGVGILLSSNLSLRHAFY